MWVDKITIFVFGKVGDDIPETDPFFRVKARSRFIQNQDVGVIQFCLCDPQPLLHAAGIGTDFPACHIMQVYQLQQLLCAGFCCFFIHSFYCGHIEHELPCREIRIEAKILGHIAQMCVILLAQSLNCFPVQTNAAGSRFQDAADHPHQCRFASPIRAKQSVHTGVSN